MRIAVVTLVVAVTLSPAAMAGVQAGSSGAPISAVRKTCDGGSPAACLELGMLYQRGQGVAKDEAAADAMFQRACDGGEPLGRLGSAVSRRLANDEPGAVAFFARSAAAAQQACDTGRPIADGKDGASGCAVLGSLYSEGWGVRKDEAHGARLFEKACSSGDLSGCFLLGNASKSGKGVPRDLERAAALYKRVCAGANDAGCYGLWDLGRMHRDGANAPKDPARAARYFEQACDLGRTSYCRRVEK